MTEGKGPRRARRETPAERRERRGAVDDPAVVLDAGLRFLEARARSTHEVRRRLSEAGYRSDLIEAAIGRLHEIGILDDALFASAWVASRDRAHPRGARALRSELIRKGLSADVIATVLEARERPPGDARAAGDDEPGSADEEAARRLMARQANALARIEDPRKRRQRAYALLARHGFTPDVAARIALEATGEGR